MARELLCEEPIRPTDTDPNMAYARALNTTIYEIMQRWTGGIQAGPGARVENVQVKDTAGTLKGFRLYLVVGEPFVYGSPKAEITE